MNIDDERSRSADEPTPSRPRFGLGRVVVVLALVWLAITVFGIVMDVVHRALVVLIVASVVFVVVKVSMASKKQP